MLSRAPDLIEGLIELAQQRKWMEVSLAVIRVSQCIIQGVWKDSDSFAQLPYFTEKEIKAIRNNCKAKTLGDFIALPAAEREKAIKASVSNNDEREEILKAIELIPNLKVDIALFVEEDEEDDESPAPVVLPKTHSGVEIKGDQIYEGDLVTLRVTLTRQNVSDGKDVAPVHTPHFPSTIYENWWFLLTDKAPAAQGKKPAEPNIHAFEKVSDRSRVVKHELRFMAPPRAGEYEMELKIISDCYAGMDIVKPFRFSVLPASELPEFKPHPEDVELDNEPTLFEQVMAANMDEDSSDDDDDEEETEKSGVGVVKKNAVTPGRGQRGIVVEDVDSEDDE